MRTARIVIGWLGLVALAVSCGGSEGAAAASPSSAFPTGVTAPGGTGPSGPTGGGPTWTLPTPPSGAGAGTLSRGELTLQLSGDVELETTITELISGVYAPPPGGMAVVWTAGGTDATTVGIGGASFTGTRRTAVELSLTIAAQTSDGIASFLSNAGECTVRIDVATPSELAGSFACRDLEDPTGVVVDASGSFRATG
jgi:hypothetical protein